MTMPGDVGEQAETALRTIEAALREAGFAMSDVVRVRTTVTDAAFQDVVFAVTGRWFGEIRPEMKVEIEATAFRR